MFEVEKSSQCSLGLDDDLYSQIRGQILAMEPLPSLQKIFNILTQEEQHKKLTIGRDDQMEAAIAYTVSHSSKLRVLTEKCACKHCGCYGHEGSNCYEIIGYPPDWGTHGKGRG